MASKIVTLRLPKSTYNILSSAAAVAGLPLSVFVRSKIDRAEVAASLDNLTAEIQKVAANHRAPSQVTRSREREILLLLRAAAAHLNPQIPSAVAAKLRAEAVAAVTNGAQR